MYEKQQMCALCELSCYINVVVVVVVVVVRELMLLIGGVSSTCHVFRIQQMSLTTTLDAGSANHKPPFSSAHDGQPHLLSHTAGADPSQACSAHNMTKMKMTSYS